VTISLVGTELGNFDTGIKTGLVHPYGTIIGDADVNVTVAT
jgi:hypothetical protein